MKKEERCPGFREKLRQALGKSTAKVVRKTAKKVFGISSGQRKGDKENW